MITALKEYSDEDLLREIAERGAGKALAEYSFDALLDELRSRKDFEGWLENELSESYEEGERDGFANAKEDQENTKIAIARDLAWLIARGETEEALDRLYNFVPDKLYPPLHYIRAVRKERAKKEEARSAQARPGSKEEARSGEAATGNIQEARSAERATGIQI